MRSIRLSLTVYFLVLLAVALAAASVFVYQTAQQTLLSEQKARRQLIETQYAERGRAEEPRLDADLLAEAQTLARLAKFQFDWARAPPRGGWLGVLSAAAGPNAYAATPLWIAQGLHGPLSFELHRRGLARSPSTGPTCSKRCPTSISRSTAPGGLPTAPSRWATAPSRSAPTRSSRTRGRRGSSPTTISARSPRAPRRLQILRPHRFPAQPRPRRAPSGAAGPAPGIAAALADLHPVRRFHPRPRRRPGRPQASRDRDLARLDAETTASLAGLRNRLLLIGTAAFLAAVLGCYVLVRLGLSPLRRLSDAVSRVSEKDFRLPVDQRRLPGELKPIARRMADTLEMLKRAFAREKQATADISHELRTPLAALLTTTEIALRKPRTAEEYQELLRDCRLSAQQMTQAVERLLALARLDAGVDRLRPQAIDAAELAEQCAALVRPLAEARGLTLTVHCTGAAPVTADPDKLREVLTNLLHNAVEYNRPDGAIDLTVARENGRLEVEVRDTGVGIGPEAKAHLFERFYRADPSRAGDGLHAGLGLAIVKGYVDLMGGGIEVESVEGRGSTFRVLLPAS